LCSREPLPCTVTPGDPRPQRLQPAVQRGPRRLRPVEQRLRLLGRHLGHVALGQPIDRRVDAAPALDRLWQRWAAEARRVGRPRRLGGGDRLRQRRDGPTSRDRLTGDGGPRGRVGDVDQAPVVRDAEPRRGVAEQAEVVLDRDGVPQR
jgi:hypothetical protein